MSERRSRATLPPWASPSEKFLRLDFDQERRRRLETSGSLLTGMALSALAFHFAGDEQARDATTATLADLLDDLDSSFFEQDDSQFSNS